MNLAVVALLAVASCVSVETEEPQSSSSSGKPDGAGRSAPAMIASWNYDLSAQDRHDKYCKMSTTAFSFYRGTNHLFWNDLAADERLQNFGSPTTQTWIQGDLHAYNYGSFDNADGDVVYALNDFDESMISDYQFDLWRMATSLVLLARTNDNLSKRRQREMLDRFTEAYLDAMGDYRGNRDEVDRVFDEDETSGLLSDFLDDVEDDASREEALDSWTYTTGVGMRFFDLSNERIEPVSLWLHEKLQSGIADYRLTTPAPARDASYFQVKDIARRVKAGTGSLGTPRFYVLIEGPSLSTGDDRILDVKRQSKPTPYLFLNDAAREAYDLAFADDAERHTAAMRALVYRADPLSGWLSILGTPYSVRERSIFKESFPANDLDRSSDYKRMAEQWGLILATAHARADRDYDQALVDWSIDREIDELTDGKHGRFRSQIREVAFDYADQVEADYDEFLDLLVPPNCP